MANLIVNRIDLNDSVVVVNLIKVIRKLAQNSSSYYPLKFKPPYYFEVPNRQIQPEGGWYIILMGKEPLYVGKADDLNKRLNTNTGSLDNFANEKRNSDSERNFIKKFVELKILSSLRVFVVKEKDVCSELNINPNALTGLDRGNIEKLINIFRCGVDYQ